MNVIEPFSVGLTLDTETEGVDNEAALVGDGVWLVDGEAVAVGVAAGGTVGAAVAAHEATRRPARTLVRRRLIAWVPRRPGMVDSLHRSRTLNGTLGMRRPSTLRPPSMTPLSDS
ncbi:MAG TPA: hypothetical protein VLR93_02385 [Patescibacteria group bacterium]|nr:hypothetical protein [Patescibacteria group bacterium]